MERLRVFSWSRPRFLSNCPRTPWKCDAGTFHVSEFGQRDFQSKLDPYYMAHGQQGHSVYHHVVAKLRAGFQLSSVTNEVILAMAGKLREPGT